MGQVRGRGDFEHAIPFKQRRSSKLTDHPTPLADATSFDLAFERTDEVAHEPRIRVPLADITPQFTNMVRWSSFPRVPDERKSLWLPTARFFPGFFTVFELFSLAHPKPPTRFVCPYTHHDVLIALLFLSPQERLKPGRVTIRAGAQVRADTRRGIGGCASQKYQIAFRNRRAFFYSEASQITRSGS